MTNSPTAVGASLLKDVEALVRRAAHGRIRNLEVEQVQGRVVVRGQAASQHTKQLAVHAALELLSSDEFCPDITVAAGRS